VFWKNDRRRRWRGVCLVQRPSIEFLLLPAFNLIVYKFVWEMTYLGMSMATMTCTWTSAQQTLFSFNMLSVYCKVLCKCTYLFIKTDDHNVLMSYTNVCDLQLRSYLHKVLHCVSSVVAKNQSLHFIWYKTSYATSYFSSCLIYVVNVHRQK
jgi:hypothetical protein